MTLTKTREKLVEDRMDALFMVYGMPKDARYIKDLREALTQALNDYTESIVRMMEKVDSCFVWGKGDGENPFDSKARYISKDQLLKELNK